MSDLRESPDQVAWARARLGRAAAYARENAKRVMPLAAVAVGLVIMLVLMLTGPAAERRDRDVALPFVRVIEAVPQTFPLVVRSYGTVAPRSQSDLVPEVSGPVIWVSAALVSGGFFTTDEPLLRIDPRDYEVGVARARAGLVRAESEHRRARKDLARRRGLAKQDFASTAQLDESIASETVTGALLDEARASLSQAERDLERTEIRAPYAGRVRDENVDVGQFVARGSPIARLYAVDRAEVRLPVADQELAFLDLPLLYGGEVNGGRPEVILRARFAGADHEWRGHVERTEGEIDEKTRRVHVIAIVEDPYATEGERPPLAVGLFVEADILGRVVEDAIVLPRRALRGPERVYVIDAEDRLRFRQIEVLRTTGDRAIVRSGLRAGELVCISPLETAVDGMRVRVVRDTRPETDL